jgi:hypothetical protein
MNNNSKTNDDESRSLHQEVNLSIDHRECDDLWVMCHVSCLTSHQRSLDDSSSRRRKNKHCSGQERVKIAVPSSRFVLLVYDRSPNALVLPLKTTIIPT